MLVYRTSIVPKKKLLNPPTTTGLCYGPNTRLHKGKNMNGQKLTDWERKVFSVLSERKEDGLDTVMAVLAEAPTEMSYSLHQIITKHIGFHYLEDDDDSFPDSLPLAYKSSRKFDDASGSMFTLLANSQAINFWRDNLDEFDRHLILLAFILNDQDLSAEKELLTYVLEEITDEVTSSLVDFRDDIMAGSESVTPQDLNLFDWCADRIELLSGRRYPKQD